MLGLLLLLQELLRLLECPSGDQLRSKDVGWPFIGVIHPIEGLFVSSFDCDHAMGDKALYGVKKALRSH